LGRAFHFVAWAKLGQLINRLAKPAAFLQTAAQHRMAAGRPLWDK
jgi:hypothetical protein